MTDYSISIQKRRRLGNLDFIPKLIQIRTKKINLTDYYFNKYRDNLITSSFDLNFYIVLIKL